MITKTMQISLKVKMHNFKVNMEMKKIRKVIKTLGTREDRFRLKKIKEAMKKKFLLKKQVLERL